MEYKDDNGACVPLRVHTIVISTQHDDDVTQERLRKDLRVHVINHVIPASLLDERTVYHLNPSGRFVIGGPQGDAGLTGRKIIVDTYGGWGAHGGGAFSGKDFSKVSLVLILVHCCFTDVLFEPPGVRSLNLFYFELMNKA